MLVIRRLLSVLKRKFVENFYRNIPVSWIKKEENSRLRTYLSRESIAVPKNKMFSGIEAIAHDTNRQGPQDLWSGYKENNDRGATRVPNDVRTNRLMGEFYSYLVQRAQPEIIVEFGAAFGVSGMYFLSGLETYSGGKLLSFEPNVVWAEMARSNLSKISDKYELVSGTFEENIGRVLPGDKRIDLAFIDAIHTKEFVLSQLDIVVGLANPGALIILDDINFSDNMRECWSMVANDPRFCSSAKLGDRVGVVELAHK
jgi:predicted O-methyltransferase YrrM